MPSARRREHLRPSAASAMLIECYGVIPRNTVMGGGVTAQPRHKGLARRIGGEQALGRHNGALSLRCGVPPRPG